MAAVGRRRRAARVGRDLGGEAGLVVDRAHHGDARRAAHVVVLLAEPGRHVDDPGALVGGDEVAGEHPEGARVVGEELEQRSVGAPDQLGYLSPSPGARPVHEGLGRRRRALRRGR